MTKHRILTLLIFALSSALWAQDKGEIQTDFWNERYFQARSSTAKNYIFQAAANKADEDAIAFLESWSKKAGKSAEGVHALAALRNVTSYPFTQFVFEVAAAATGKDKKRQILLVLTEPGPHRERGYEKLLQELEIHQSDSHGLLYLSVLKTFEKAPAADNNTAFHDLLLSVFEGPQNGPLRSQAFLLSRDLKKEIRQRFDVSSLLLLDPEFALRSARQLLIDEVDGVEDLIVALFLDETEAFFRAGLDRVLEDKDNLLLRLKFIRESTEMTWNQLEYLRHTSLALKDRRLGTFLASSLLESGEKRRILALWMIRDLHQKTAVSTLLKLRSEDLSESVRLLLSDTLALLTGKVAYFKEVKKFLSEGSLDQQLRRLELAEKVHLGGPHMKEWLRKKLRASKGNWKIMGPLIRLAADMGLDEAITICDEALEHARWQIKLAGIEGLIRIGTRPALSRLSSLTNDTHLRLARKASDGLRSMTGMNLGANPDGWRKVIATLGTNWEANRTPLRKPIFEDSDRYGAQFYGLDLKSNRVIFVCDISGSMRGRKIKELKEELWEAIQSIRAPESAFNAIFFAGHVDAIWSRLAHLRKSTRSKAQKAIGRIQANGGTDVFQALERAYADTLADTIVVLTDGQPSVGKVTDTATILSKVQAWNRYKRLQIHTIYLPEDVETDQLRVISSQQASSFMRALAKIGEGQFLEPR